MIPLLSGPADELSLELFELLLFPLTGWKVFRLLEVLQPNTMATKSNAAMKDLLYDIDKKSPPSLAKASGNFLTAVSFMQIAVLRKLLPEISRIHEFTLNGTRK